MATAKIGVTFTMSRRAKRWLSGQSAAEFQKAVRNREAEAAKEATAVSRTTFQNRLGPRPHVPPRAGRPTTGGNFARDIEWKPQGDGSIGVNWHKLPRYWLIQEIGTGQKANIVWPPATVAVQSQVGRYISANFVWMNGGQEFAASTARRGMDQLRYATALQGVRLRRIRIRREIKGKHYLRDGGAAGFRHLDKKLVSDARRIFQ